MDDTILYWLLAPPVAVGLFFLARWARIRWLDARLDRAVDEAGVQIAKLGPFAGISAAEVGAVGACSVYDAIRTLVMVDDRVLDAIDFSRGGVAAGFERVQDHLATRVATAGETGSALKDNLLGFYADQMTAAHLAAEGHVVEFAHGTAPGADLLVDGHPYHVEIGLDPTLVKQHLAQFPDVTVVVSQELAPHFEGVANVLADPALSHADAADHVQKTIERVGEIGKPDMHFPFITFTIAVFAYAPLVFRRRLSVRDAARFTALDTGLLGGGAMALGKAGSLVGLGLGPVGAAAGGILGALAGGLGGAAGASWLKGRTHRGAVARFERELEEFGGGLPDALLAKRSAVARKQHRVTERFPHSSAARAWLWPTMNDRIFRRLTADFVPLLARIEEQLGRAQALLAGEGLTDTSPAASAAAAGRYGLELVQAGEIWTPEVARRVRAMARAGAEANAEAEKLAAAREAKQRVVAAVTSRIRRGVARLNRWLGADRHSL
jgi:hypothetical protein